MNIPISSSWKKKLQNHLETEKFRDLYTFVNSEYEREIIYPAYNHIFNAFEQTSFEETKVVILGQDPYHKQGQAHGLAFSVAGDAKIPPSLKNILKEVRSDIGESLITSGDLTAWAKQGVLLLNSVLTVKQNSPASHANQGWEDFTDYVIKTLSEEKDHLVFILWGSYAQKKRSIIDTSKHLVLESPHPSPLSSYRGFFGSRPFSKTNSFLRKMEIRTISW